tara:strand:+ start:1878 stop:2213 length:336 start_codon:yes stop_codon:yes gene_type:complete
MNVILNSKNVDLEIMSTPDSRTIGMMGREYLNGGMIFLFPEISEHSFWMKNCLINLDIIFIVNSKITKIYLDCPPCNNNSCPSYSGIADKVLELPSGKYSVNEGDLLEFTN